MSIITRKPEINTLVSNVIESYHGSGLHEMVNEINHSLLSAKIKFPLLEYVGEVLFQELREKDQIQFCDHIAALKTIGGHVIIGITLQRRLGNHFEESISKAAVYIGLNERWEACDIIGERVFGVSLLQQPEKTIPEVEKLSTHPSKWVVRSLGAGIHYCIKKGLDKLKVQELFRLLLKMSTTTDKEVKQGVGWAAKTTAKFHPDIIETHKTDISKAPKWFQTKVRIGLERNAYAKRNQS